MKTAIEDRLRHALALEANAVEVASPGGVDDGSTPGHGPRLPAVVAALALVAVLMVALVAHDDRGSRLQATSPPGRLYLAPTEVDRFRVVHAAISPTMDLENLSARRMFGRRSDDGRSVTARVEVLVYAGTPAVAPPGETLLVEGERVPIQRGSDGNTMLIWEEDGDRQVHVATSGLSSVELVALVASLRPGPAETANPALPARFVPAPPSVTATGPEVSVIRQAWVGSGPNRGFKIAVAEDSALSLESLAWRYPGARPTTVRGQPGVVFDGRRRELAWLERPGAVVTLESEGLTVSQLRGVAERLRPIDQAAWERLVAAAQAVSDPQPIRGPATVVATGERGGSKWEAKVYELAGAGDPAVCLEVASLDLCHQLHLAVRGVGGLYHGPDFLTGTVGREVARLQVVFADGRTVDAQPVGREAGFPMAFLVVPLGDGERPELVVALDGEGRELSRSEVGPVVSPSFP